MKLRTTFIFLMMLLNVPLLAQPERTDVIIMKNGDRITCEITGVKYGTLYARLDYIDGIIEIDWSKVAKVESNRLFIIKTEDGSFHEGKISPAEPGPGNEPKLNVTIEPAKTLKVPTADVVRINTSSEKLWRRFNGNVNFGLNYSKDNNATQYNLNSTIEYPRELWGLEASFDSILSANEGIETSHRNEATVRVYRRLNQRNWFVDTSFGFLQSTEQGIPRQFTFVGGLGHFFTDSNRSRISLTGGLALQRTNYKTDGALTSSETQLAGFVGSEIRYFRFLKSGLKLRMAALPSINEPGRFFFKLNQDYYYRIFYNLIWNISIYGSWDNRPPLGLPGSDYGTSTGIGWTFGSR